MASHLLLKLFLVFVGGVIFAVFAIQLFTNRHALLTLGEGGLGGNFENEFAEPQSYVQGRVDEKKGQVAGSFAENVVDRVVSSIAENPALEPFFEAKEDVEKTVDTVLALPEEQRNAICTQVCGQ